MPGATDAAVTMLARPMMRRPPSARGASASRRPSDAELRGRNTDRLPTDCQGRQTVGGGHAANCRQRHWPESLSKDELKRLVEDAVTHATKRQPIKDERSALHGHPNGDAGRVRASHRAHCRDTSGTVRLLRSWAHPGTFLCRFPARLWRRWFHLLLRRSAFSGQRHRQHERVRSVRLRGAHGAVRGKRRSRCWPTSSRRSSARCRQRNPIKKRTVKRDRRCRRLRARRLFATRAARVRAGRGCEDMYMPACCFALHMA